MDPRDPAFENQLFIFAVSHIFFSSSRLFRREIQYACLPNIQHLCTENRLYAIAEKNGSFSLLNEHSHETGKYDP